MLYKRFFLMKNSDLIKYLQRFDGSLEVSTSDKKGIFSDIDSVELQEWKSNGKNMASVTLVLGKYNSDNKVKPTSIQTAESNEDEKFIDNVNKNLSYCDKIDKEEAFKAKKYFDTDFNDMQKKYKDWFYNRYNEFAHESMCELFEDDKPIDNKTIGDLKYYVYKNGWQDELDGNDINNRYAILRLLYTKLDEKVKEKVTNSVDDIWKDVNSVKTDIYKTKYQSEVDKILNCIENCKREINRNLISEWKEFSPFNTIFLSKIPLNNG